MTRSSDETITSGTVQKRCFVNQEIPKLDCFWDLFPGLRPEGRRWRRAKPGADVFRDEINRPSGAVELICFGHWRACLNKSPYSHRSREALQGGHSIDEHAWTQLREIDPLAGDSISLPKRAPDVEIAKLLRS